MWIAGDSGALFRWDGEEWIDVSPEESRTFLAAAGIDGELWFAGADGLAIDSQGNAVESDLTAPTYTSLVSFTDTLHALTVEGHLLTMDEGGSLRARSLSSGVEAGRMWGRASDDLFLLLQFSGEGTRLIHYDGTSRTLVDGPQGADLLDARYEAITGAGNRVVLVGAGGRVLVGDR